VGANDWCDSELDREDFIRLVAQARGQVATLRVLPASDFLRVEYPAAEVLLGSSETIIYLARGGFLLMYGDGGSGKSTLTLDAIAHLATGRDWLEIPVPRPSHVLLIENEGAAQLFQTKLRDKAAQWDADPAWLENVEVYAEPWGSFTFANPHAREALQRICEEQRVDLIVANPLFGVGGPGSGRPDETSAFIDWLKELGLGLGGPAIWLLHHENKLGQVSGDWNRQPDTLVLLARDGDQERTKLEWAKTRWANRPPEGWRKKWLLEWTVEHKGYRLLNVDLRAVSDEQLQERLDAFLREQPRASTNAVLQRVEGNDSRLRELLKSSRYRVETGPRGSNLYSLASGLGLDLEAEVVSFPGMPHE
jgi:ribosomal protein L29